MILSGEPPNLSLSAVRFDSAFANSLSGSSITVAIPSSHKVPNHGGDSNYPYIGMASIDSAEIRYIDGNYLRLGSNYFDSPYAGLYTLVLPLGSSELGNRKVRKPFFDSAETIDFGLVVDVARITNLTGGYPGFPFPAPRRGAGHHPFGSDSGFLQDSSTLDFDSAQFKVLTVGSFFLNDSIDHADSSDHVQFRFPNDSANFSKLEFNSLHFDSNDTFNLPLRRVKTLSITTDSGIDNLSAYLLSPWDSADRIT